MRFLPLLGGLLPLLGLVGAAPSCNHECNRACWTSRFNVNTDYENEWPVTGVTRKFDFEITEVDEWVGPDGHIKKGAMLINGGYPGPLIKADWGDRIEVTVTNRLKTNGTSMHWHGFHQLNSNNQDGVAGVTECPIAPGTSKVYSFLATQHGTSWYHSHISSQYANGIVGPIQINGPSSYPYDTDLGVFPISDWYYDSAEHIVDRMMNPNDPFLKGVPGSPPPSNNILFNGMNIAPNSTGGEYARLKFTKNKRHRLRLVNTSADNTFVVSIVGHNMTVIETDFVPVEPYPVHQLYLTVGQRYDVVIKADQEVDNYWINATLSSTPLCGVSLNPYPAAIVSYEGADESRLPTDRGLPAIDQFCEDDVSSKPRTSRTAPKADFSDTKVDTLSVTLDVKEVNKGISKVLWSVDGSAIDVQWDKPTLEYVVEGDFTFPRQANLIQLPEAVKWSFWVIQNNSPSPHPMHLHGHDFLILGRSRFPANPLVDPGHPILFDPLIDGPHLKFDNPTRRDTTVVPSFGWLVIAFEAGRNPGSWVFHCHIPWHMSQGLSVQFLERVDRINNGAIPNLMPDLRDRCYEWGRYADNDPEFRMKKVDSGI
ncbi:Cupredoxin [Neurospora hispaniola]|uniref:laccase n=1 Tax=Neurospora hispaniola TaxID=588809 RepID=A0AAJ0I700_9PEZI|nr:Cupredoxin [Neurospora hispaniola]